MRDIIITLLVFASVPAILMRPHVGIYVWSWISYMNPHRLSWGFASTMPFAFVISIATLVGMLFSREPKRIPWSRELIVLLIFIGWTVVTTIFALHHDLALEQLKKVAKIQFMIVITLMLIQSRERLHTMVWVVALSLGFFGLKGGIHTLLTGGSSQVLGPEGTFIGGNNEVGLALIMTIPLLRYLHLNTTKTWVRRGLIVLMGLTALAAIGTQSRGALVGLVAMSGFLWLKSRNKLPIALLITVAAVLIFTMMPAKWHDKMGTIGNYQQDASALGRINAWHFATNLALARPLVGGGYEAFQADTFMKYAPNPTDYHTAHSIYFQILGEHGLVGLVLFLAVGITVWRSGSQLIKKVRGDPQQQWAVDLVSMAQVSMIGYAVGGAFLGLAYFDYYYHLLAMIMLTKVVVENSAASLEPPATPFATGLAGAAQRLGWPHRKI